MILMEMDLKLKVTWLDPETVEDKPLRKALVRERLERLFNHEFGEMTVEKHGLKIELVNA